MQVWSNKKKPKKNIYNRDDNRYTVLLTIVFLVFLLLTTRLFWLQVVKASYYTKLANMQHEFVSKLAPIRGKIFIQDKKSDTGDGLFAIASNKEYVTVYAVPKNIKEPERLANALYEYFKKEDVEKEVDDLLKLQEKDRLEKELLAIDDFSEAEKAVKASEIRLAHDAFLKTAEYLQAKEEKKSQMIDERKKAILEKYRLIFAKQDDPYEALEKRVELKTASEFHLSLIDKSLLPLELKADDLDISYGKMHSDKLSKKLAEIKKQKKLENQEDKKTTEEEKNPLDFDGIGYETETYRVYPEKNSASHILGFVGFEPQLKSEMIGRRGQYGLEGFFDDELFGKYGEVKSEKGAGGTSITNKREVTKQVDGDDLVLTIDRTIQFYATEKIREATLKYGADSGSAIIMNPNTGEIIAMASYPDFDPNNYDKTKEVKIYNNPVIFDAYEPGSVFKTVTMASAINEGKVSPNTTYNDLGQIMINGWPKPIKNSDFETKGGHGITTMTGVLENSLNTGAIFAMRSIGDKKFAEYVKNFGFGEKTGIELEGESAGNINNLKNKKIKEIESATASFGQGITVTPIQMITSYAVVANGGKLVKPYLVKEIRHSDGKTETINSSPQRQVITKHTADLVSGMLINVVEEGHSKKAKVPGYYIGCKTGTAQFTENGQKGYVEHRYNHTFICLGPVGDPKFVVLVRFKNPKGYIYADSTAVPVTQDLMQFLVDYWELPKTRKE